MRLQEGREQKERLARGRALLYERARVGGDETLEMLPINQRRVPWVRTALLEIRPRSVPVLLVPVMQVRVAATRVAGPHVPYEYLAFGAEVVEVMRKVHVIVEPVGLGRARVQFAYHRGGVPRLAKQVGRRPLPVGQGLDIRRAGSVAVLSRKHGEPGRYAHRARRVRLLEQNRLTCEFIQARRLCGRVAVTARKAGRMLVGHYPYHVGATRFHGDASFPEWYDTQVIYRIYSFIIIK